MLGNLEPVTAPLLSTILMAVRRRDSVTSVPLLIIIPHREEYGTYNLQVQSHAKAWVAAESGVS